ncbi:YcbK family protein [Marinisporobacter balticus]|uniref:Murein endopeptidase K n=1 Tax=Marinisporobacter balticus TaxID=2018667 RepID=A0A4R2KCK9_9FIRM|nr:D-Ala-D-Ala carboxypeptidase family metallohydrolase [Marinisporobacter balticus]TCO70634.1 peptidase M15-like protein [Marinisporobacter balticus]
MIQVFKDFKVCKNFKLSEFVCKEGKNEVVIDEKLLDTLQKLRDYFNKQVIINSAYRSPSYNKKIDGSSKSQHLLGKAVDITVPGISPEKVASAGILLGFTGIGIYETFTHLDVRETLVNKAGRKYDFWDMRKRR